MQLIVLADWTVIDAFGSESGASAALDQMSDLERALWLVVLGALVLDIATTAYGLSIGLVEQNPVVRQALEAFGFAALVVAKGGAVTIAVAARFAYPKCALVAPLGLAVPWVLAVGVNLAVILSA